MTGRDFDGNDFITEVRDAIGDAKTPVRWAPDKLCRYGTDGLNTIYRDRPDSVCTDTKINTASPAPLTTGTLNLALGISPQFFPALVCFVAAKCLGEDQEDALNMRAAAAKWQEFKLHMK